MALGELFINSKDAYVEWGVSLEPGGVSALMAFPPQKLPVVNKNVTAAGAVVVCGSGLVDERHLELPLHITAPSFSSFLRRRASFESELRRAGSLTLDLVVGPAELYSHTVYYVDCRQYRQYRGGMALFLLTLYEPVPG